MSTATNTNIDSLTADDPVSASNEIIALNSSEQHTTTPATEQLLLAFVVEPNGKMQRSA